MPETDGVAIARLQEQVKGLREDMQDFSNESGRTRTRLHNLEGAVQAFADVQKRAKQDTENRQRRIEVRMEVLSVLVGVAAIAIPLITTFIPGH